MPGYGGAKMMEKYTPEPTDDVNTVEHRFVMPNLPAITLIQFVLVGLVLAHYWMNRKVNKAGVGAAMLAIGFLHFYDHLYRVKRGPERLFFWPEAPKKEGYCGACRK
tara:strand:+ start:66 stop:386 length:321 start_codon:yes stop_codon:yes gene_type:complete